MKVWNDLTKKWYTPRGAILPKIPKAPKKPKKPTATKKPKVKTVNRRPPKTWDYSRCEILSRDSHRCLYCGNRPSLDPDCRLVLDHVIPWSLGGTGTTNNVVTSCADCNGAKSNRVLTPSVLQDISSYLEEANRVAGFNPRGTIQGGDSGPQGATTSPAETS